MHLIGWKPLFLCLALAVPLAAHGVARAGPDEPPDSKAAEGKQDRAAKAQSECEALEAGYKQARTDYYKAMAERRKRKAEDPDAVLTPLTSPDAEYLEKYREGAKRWAGTPGAAPFLMKVVSMGYRRQANVAKRALGTLLDDHMDHPKLGDLTYSLIYGAHGMGNDFVRDAMTRIVDGSPHDAVKAAFLFGRGTLANRNRASTEEQRKAAVDDLRRSVALAPESRYGQRAKGTIFELEKLQIGMVAPDIEGNDLDGVAFKLSDYRGKVVLLDFWGDW